MPILLKVRPFRTACVHLGFMGPKWTVTVDVSHIFLYYGKTVIEKDNMQRNY